MAKTYRFCDGVYRWKNVWLLSDDSFFEEDIVADLQDRVDSKSRSMSISLHCNRAIKERKLAEKHEREFVKNGFCREWMSSVPLFENEVGEV